MKNIFFLGVILLFAFLSCRNDEFGPQKIDQIVQLYIDSANQDMLNARIPGSYIEVRMNDVYGFTDNAPVAFTLKKDADTVNFIEYLAGAKRMGLDSSGESKTYQSKIALILRKKVTDSTFEIANDTMVINYQMNPSVFQVSQVWYNNKLEFSKVDGAPNIIKISK